MNEFVAVMIAPFAASMVLVAIHTYLGLHVLEREVIFVDLALAQVAALGAVVGTLFGLALHSQGAYLFSLGATLIGAALFAFSRPRTRVAGARVPHEAIIGIVYAVSASAVILVLDRAPSGAEHVRELLVGSILWVSWTDIGKMSGMYVLIGAFHWIFRAKFLLVSKDPEAARQAGISLLLWDFLFYLSFGFVVTVSVSLAGVLLVFCILIIPAVCACLACQGLGTRILVGWSFGTLGAIVGLAASYWLDFPTGATVACALGSLLVIWGGVLRVTKWAVR